MTKDDYFSIELPPEECLNDKGEIICECHKHLIGK
jgi:hypothetical protein